MRGFQELYERLIHFADTSKELKALIMFGSQARTDHGADEYSDFDLMLFVDDKKRFAFKDDWLIGIGNFFISVVENAPINGYERKVFFDKALDIDFRIYDTKDMNNVLKNESIQEWFSRGYKILKDNIQCATLLEYVKNFKPTYPEVTQEDFSHTVQDFWYYALRGLKKICRGEIWSGKNCIDGLMKDDLRLMIEWNAQARKEGQTDIWRYGRFIDEWADKDIMEKVKNSFGSYDKSCLKDALINTAHLFGKLAEETARLKGFVYEKRSEEYSLKEIDRLFN